MAKTSLIISRQTAAPLTPVLSRALPTGRGLKGPTMHCDGSLQGTAQLCSVSQLRCLPKRPMLAVQVTLTCSYLTYLSYRVIVSYYSNFNKRCLESWRRLSQGASKQSSKYKYSIPGLTMIGTSTLHTVRLGCKGLCSMCTGVALHVWLLDLSSNDRSNCVLWEHPQKEEGWKSKHSCLSSVVRRISSCGQYLHLCIPISITAIVGANPK